MLNNLKLNSWFFWDNFNNRIYNFFASFFWRGGGGGGGSLIQITTKGMSFLISLSFPAYYTWNFVYYTQNLATRHRQSSDSCNTNIERATLIN